MPHFSSQFFTKNLYQNHLIIFNSFPPADRYCELARISHDPFHVNKEMKMKRKFYESTHVFPFLNLKIKAIEIM